MADITARSRDEVLLAFHATCPRPTAAEVAAWAERHPDVADDLRYHARALLAGAPDPDLQLEAPMALLERTRGRALAALAAARGVVEPERVTTLSELMAAAATDLPRLARDVGLGRAPPVDLVQGRVKLPAPRALLVSLADALRATVAQVDAATRVAHPSMGHARADGAPSAPRRASADVVRDDPTMTPERKAHWLSVFAEG